MPEEIRDKYNVIMNAPRLLFLSMALLIPLLGPSTETTRNAEKFKGPQGYYRLNLAEGWKAVQEKDFVKLTRNDTDTVIRIYELALRSKGGLYRDKRHALDDLKFQVVHEFKGEGKPYQTLKWEAGGQPVQARSFEGTFPKGEKRVHVFGVIIPAKDPEVVISFHCIGSEASYREHAQEIKTMLHSLEVLN